MVNKGGATRPRKSVAADARKKARIAKARLLTRAKRTRAKLLGPRLFQSLQNFGQRTERLRPSVSPTELADLFQKGISLSMVRRPQLPPAPRSPTMREKKAPSRFDPSHTSKTPSRKPRSPRASSRAPSRASKSKYSNLTESQQAELARYPGDANKANRQRLHMQFAIDKKNENDLSAAFGRAL